MAQFAVDLTRIAIMPVAEVFVARSAEKRIARYVDRNLEPSTIAMAIQ